MKKLLYITICILSSILIITFPSQTIKGISAGVNITLYSVIPSLMPFIIIINIIISKNLCTTISNVLYPAISPFIKLTRCGCFAMICGFICGYPLGCKTIMDLLNSNQISKNEACLLLTFCNNASISYVSSYIAYLCLGNNFPTYLLFIFIYLPSFLCGIINSNFIFKKQFNELDTKENKININIVNSTIKSLSTIGFYVIVFTTITSWLKIISSNTNFITITSFLEIVSGSKNISSASYEHVIKLFIISVFTITGGFSISMQVVSFISEKSMIKYYLLGKIEALFIFLIIFELFLVYFR